MIERSGLVEQMTRSIEIIRGRRSWPKAGEGHWKVVARGVWQCHGWRRREERMKSDF